jgi:L-lactate utilization protein LutC
MRRITLRFLVRTAADDTCNAAEEIAMKVLATLTLKSDANLESVRSELANEIRGSWALYSSGVLREAYATEVATRVVFVIEADNAAAAKCHLVGLPLVAAGMFQMEFVELRPFVNWAALFRTDNRQ